MPVDLIEAMQLDVRLWFSRKVNRWVALAPEVNVTVSSYSEKAAIEKLCIELHEEEKAIADFGPPMAADPAPAGANQRRVRRLPDGRWAPT